MFGRPTLRPRLLEEATSLGAAIAGGVGVGLINDFSIIHQGVEIVDRHIPNPQVQAVYDRLYPIFLETYTALVPIFDQLHEANSL